MKLNFLSKVVLVFAFLVHFQNVYATGNCSEGHCSNIAAKMNEFCNANNMKGKPFLVLGKNGEPYYCQCSCLAGDAAIELASGLNVELDSIVEGDQLYTPQSEQKSEKVSKVLKSDIVEGKVVKLNISNGKTLVAGPNHVFITAPDETISAEKLAVGSSVQDGDSKMVTVTEKEDISNFSGELRNVIIAGAEKNNDNVKKIILLDTLYITKVCKRKNKNQVKSFANNLPDGPIKKQILMGVLDS